MICVERLYSTPNDLALCFYVYVCVQVVYYHSFRF